jgi:pseudaminic acid biosynthesis-associated methylase
MSAEKSKYANPQLKEWSSEFGDEYVERNLFQDWKLEPGKKAFAGMLEGIEVNSVLEVGSNVGLNLIYINENLKGEVDLYAVEPNQKAFEILTSQKNIQLKKASNCSAYQIPHEDNAIDLCFTSGVLIHIPPSDLGRATDEIVRVSKKYVLCSEYFSHNPEEIEYRGQTGLLFKRDFGGFYLDRYSNLKCINYGFLWQREYKIFDNLTWWLFEKI